MLTNSLSLRENDISRKIYKPKGLDCQDKVHYEYSVQSNAEGNVEFINPIPEDFGIVLQSVVVGRIHSVYFGH